MCQRQSSSGSALAMAQVMPPWADTVWERVGNAAYDHTVKRESTKSSHL
jgi:hypothetical protein